MRQQRGAGEHSAAAEERPTHRVGEPVGAQVDTRSGDHRGDGRDRQPYKDMARLRAEGNGHDAHERQRGGHVTGREGVRECDLDRFSQPRVRRGDDLLTDGAANPNQTDRRDDNEPGPGRPAEDRDDQRRREGGWNDETRRSDLGERERLLGPARTDMGVDVLRDLAVEPDRVAPFANVVRHRDK